MLTENVRGMDMVARFGGEEFTILLPETNLENATIVAEHLREMIEGREFIFQEYAIRVTASFGVAPLTAGEEKNAFDRCYGQVDAALYRAKNNGRNQVVAAE